jgi:HSP20 family protein
MYVTELIPTNWKTCLERLRKRIHQVVGRWLTREKPSVSEDGEFWHPIAFQSVGRGIELGEEDDKLIAKVVLPGVDKKDVKVEVTENRLVIRGDRHRSRENRGRGYRRYEESSASFAQAIALPCEIDRDRVKAKYKSGILTVSLAKSERAKNKHIKIGVS